MVERLINKIVQINYKVIEKLTELNIIEEVRINSLEVIQFEKILRDFLSNLDISNENLFFYLVMRSRMRFIHEAQRDHSCQKVCSEVKDVLQELVIANDPKTIEHAKALLKTNLNLTFLQMQFEFSDRSSQEPMSYRVKASRLSNSNNGNFIVPCKFNSDCPSTPAKPIDHAADRSSSVGLHYSRVRSNIKTSGTRYSKDLKPRRDVGQNSDSQQDQTDIQHNTVSNYQVYSSQSVLSNREVNREKRVIRLRDDDRGSKTTEFNTTESESHYNFSNIQHRTSTSPEGALRIEAESVKLREYNLSLNTYPLSNEEIKEIECSGGGLFKTGQTSIQDEDVIDNKSEELSPQRRRNTSPKQRNRVSYLKSPISIRQNNTSSQNTDNTLSIALYNSATSMRVHDILKNNSKGFNKQEISGATEVVKETKTTKSTLSEMWKNYDIMNIEYRPMVTTSKVEFKKVLLDRAYNELVEFNIEIRKTIHKYFNYAVTSRVSVQPNESYYINVNSAKEALMRSRKSYLRQNIKAQRSISIDNTRSDGRVYKSVTYKLGRDAKDEVETSGNVKSSIPQVPQVNSNLLKKNIPTKVQTSKANQKAFVLPKLYLLDSNTHASSTSNSEYPSKRIKSSFKAMNYAAEPISKTGPRIIKVITGSKSSPRASSTENISREPVGFNQDQNVERTNLQATNRASNRGQSLENIPIENNASVVQIGISPENLSLIKKKSKEVILTNDSLRKKLKLLGYSLEKKDFLEMKNNFEDICHDVNKQYLVTPNDPIKSSIPTENLEENMT